MPAGISIYLKNLMTSAFFENIYLVLLLIVIQLLRGRNETERFLSHLYMQIFLTGTGYIDVMGWFLLRLAECGIEQVILKLFLLVKIVDKTYLPNSIFRFNSTFLLLFINLATLWNQKGECFRTYICYQKNSHA